MIRTAWWLLTSAVATASAVATTLPPDGTLHYSVLRNGSPIGMTTIRVQHGRSDLLAETVTHIRVKLGFVTLYTLDQAETEHWAEGRFRTLSAETDDNGARHMVSARVEGSAVHVEADGKSRRIGRPVIPDSLWNPAPFSQKEALSPQDGSIVPHRVVDRGIEQIAVGGRATTAHRYLIQGTFVQSVWYDRNNRLVKMEMLGTDGSKVEYRLE